MIGCCGEKRAAFRSPLTSPPSPPVQRTTPTPPPPGLQPGYPGSQPRTNVVAVRYLETSPISVRGMPSGSQYQFSGAHPLQAVNVRDAEILVRTRFFRRATY